MFLKINHIYDLKKINKKTTSIFINFYDGEIEENQFSKVTNFNYPVSIKHIQITFFCPENVPSFNLKFLEQFIELESLFLGEDKEGFIVGTDTCNLSSVKLSPTLIELNAVCCGIKNFKFLKCLKNLKILDLTANRINYLRQKDLPQNLEKFVFSWHCLYAKNLGWNIKEKWYIKKNNVFSKLNNLKYLELQLDEFPSNIQLPIQLEEIRFGGEGQNIILNFEHCKKIKWINLPGLSQIKKITLPQDSENFISLDIQNTGIHFMDFIENTKVKSMTIDNNQFESLKKIKAPICLTNYCIW